MKKFILAISAAVLMCCAVAGLTACGGASCQHNYEEDVSKRVEATCHSDGTKYLVCSLCGDEQTETVTDRPAHDYDNGEWVKVDGENHAKQCANEGCTEVSTDTSTHNFVADTSKTDIPATCHSDGTNYKKCPDCGAEKTETVTDRPAHDYDNGEWVKVDGENHAKQCANEGCTEISTDTSTHNFVADTAKTDIPATCHSDGTNYKKCSDCGAEKAETVTDRPAHDYDSGEWVKVDGENHAKQCANDGCTEISAETTAHTWNEGTVTVQPEFMKKGEKTFTCGDCGDTKTEEVAALTSVSHAESFSLSQENNPWGYGKLNITGWDGDNFQYDVIAATGTSTDAYTGDGIEIKVGWISGNCNFISYTAAEAMNVKIDVTATQVSGGKRMDVRLVKGNSAEYYGAYDGNNLTCGKEFNLSEGDTVYVVFSPKGEDAGFEQTDFTINISLIA